MCKRRNHAFTLMELLVVITVIVLLILIMLPSFGAARAFARTGKCTANLHGFSTAIATRQADQALTTPTNACSMMDLPPYLTDNRIYVCPEDNPVPEIDAKMAVYKGSPHDSAHYMYDMQFGLTLPGVSAGSYYADPWTFRTQFADGSYFLNFEDERPGFGDHSYYNYYLQITPNTPTSALVQSLSKVPAGDVPPTNEVYPHSDGWKPIVGQALHAIGTQYDIQHLSGVSYTAGPAHNWVRGDAFVPVVPVTPFGLSYGMNARYPSTMAIRSNGIIIFDFMRSGFDSEAETSSQWTTDLKATAVRPGFARHTGRFNALFRDGSVRTGLVPTVVNPTLAGAPGTLNKQAWWGAP